MFYLVNVESKEVSVQTLFLKSWVFSVYLKMVRYFAVLNSSVSMLHH